MRMEEEYRRRLHQVSNTVKRRLDYQVDVEQTQRKFEQKHMVQWLEDAVTQLVKGKQVSIASSPGFPLRAPRERSLANLSR